MRWLTRLLGGPHKSYKYQAGDDGPTHVVYARNLDQAEKRMRAFISDTMFGPFALFHYPASIERAFRKCRLIDYDEMLSDSSLDTFPGKVKHERL